MADKTIVLNVFENVHPSEERSVDLIHLLDVVLSFSWTQTAQELQLTVPVGMIFQQIDVDTHFVDSTNVDFLKGVHQLCLIYHVLKRMKIDMQSLVFRNFLAPQIQNFIHGILLKSGQADALFNG